MTEKTRCIVLKTVKYGDQSLIIDLLTRECGRVSVVWRAPKNKKGRVGRSHFQLLNILEIDLERRPSVQLPQLKEVRIASTYESIPFDAVKTSVAFFLAEFLTKVTTSSQKDEWLYDFVENSLLWYDATTDAIANFHLMFMLRISKFLGFYPNLDDNSDHCYFDLKAARFTATAPLHRDFLQPEETRNIMLLLRMTPSNMHLFRFSRNERNRITEIILHYYSLHLPDFRQMKSWQVLREIFGA